MQVRVSGFVGSNELGTFCLMAADAEAICGMAAASLHRCSLHQSRTRHARALLTACCLGLTYAAFVGLSIHLVMQDHGSHCVTHTCQPRPELAMSACMLCAWMFLECLLSCLKISVFPVDVDILLKIVFGFAFSA